MFHRFHSSHGSSQWQGTLSPEEFENILVFVGIQNILSPQEWMSRLESNRLGKHDLCITFDDGLRCQVEYALPVLERHGLQAFWSIYSCVFESSPVKSEIYSYVAGQIGELQSITAEFLERCPPEMLVQLESDDFARYANRMREVAPFYSANDMKYRFLRNRPSNKESFESLMDEIIREHGFELEEVARQLWLMDSDLRDLTEKGHIVGLHSYDHPYEIARLSREEQQEQYQRNFAHILTVCGKKPISMSHPLNSYNEDSLSVLKELEIRCGFRANMVPPSSKAINSSYLELAREDSANLLRTLMEGKP